MGVAADDFITQFHNLPGTTAKEKQRNLFALFRQHPSLKNNGEQLDVITANLQPTNHLEEIFRVDFLIYFQRYKELYENFIKGDDITLKKLSKQDWFYETAFKEVGAEDFASNILPSLSYSLKLHVLNKIPVDQECADRIFDAVKKRYGVHLACVLLLKCTSGKIQEVLKKYPVKLTHIQLREIYKKDINLIYTYIEERVKFEGNSTFLDNNPLMLHIARHNPEMFCNLFNKYKFKIELGRRATKHYVTSQKDKILSEPEAYVDILNKSAVVRKLGSEMQNIFFKHSPKRDQPYWEILLEHYPQKKQFKIYETAYNSFYHYKFGENIDMINEHILKIIPNLEEREKLAKKKLKEEGKEMYLKYFTPQHCLEEFLEKVNHLTLSERTSYVEIVTNCCIINKDYNTFLKICELICVRFKNNDSKIRQEFFSAIGDNKSFINNFTELHWKFIIEILATANAKEEWIFWQWLFWKEYVKFLLKNNMSIKETISKYGQWPEVLHYTDVRKERVLFKSLLIELLEVGHPKPNPSIDHDAEYFDCQLASYCKDYNDCYPDDAIPVHEHSRVLKSVRHVLENETDTYVDSKNISGVECIIFRRTDSQEFQELKKMYFKAFKTFGGEKGLRWFLKNDPKTLQENLDNMFDNFFQTYYFNWKRICRYLKKYDYLELDKRTIEFCKFSLQTKFEKITSLNKKDLINALSTLATPHSYLEFVKPYIPTSGKVDLTDEEAKNKYSLQTDLVKVMHLVRSHKQILPTVLEFCKGDYLKFGLRPLYSCFYKIPEEETKVFIDDLNKNKALSLKKHVVNLSCIVYDVDTIQGCLENTDVPVLMPALKYFAKNPSDTLWQFIKTKINNTEKKDLQALKWVINVNVSIKYKSEFLETIWNVLERHENKEIRKILITKVDKECMKNFDSQFAFKILRKSIFKLNEANKFAADLLIYLKNDDKFTVFSVILKEFKENFWNHKEARRTARKKIQEFVLVLFKNYMESETTNTKFVSEISTLFGSVFTTSEAFEALILIKCMIFKSENFENCSKLIMELNNSFEKNYSYFAINLFADVIRKNVFKHVCTTDSEQLKLCHSLFKIKSTVNDSLLVLALLPKKQLDSVNDVLLYEEILNEFSEIDDDVVQLQLNMYLKADSENCSTTCATGVYRGIYRC